MVVPQGYTDIAEVRTVTGATACNQLLAEGWVLLGAYHLTRVGNGLSWGAGETETSQDTSGMYSAYWPTSGERAVSQQIKKVGEAAVAVFGGLGPGVRPKTMLLR
jgi:hypothetical protein